MGKIQRNSTNYFQVQCQSTHLTQSNLATRNPDIFAARQGCVGMQVVTDVGQRLAVYMVRIGRQRNTERAQPLHRYANQLVVLASEKNVDTKQWQ